MHISYTYLCIHILYLLTYTYTYVPQIMYMMYAHPRNGSSFPWTWWHQTGWHIRVKVDGGNSPQKRWLSSGTYWWHMDSVKTNTLPETNGWLEYNRFLLGRETAYFQGTFVLGSVTCETHGRPSSPSSTRSPDCRTPPTGISLVGLTMPTNHPKTPGFFWHCWFPKHPVVIHQKQLKPNCITKLFRHIK